MESDLTRLRETIGLSRLAICRLVRRPISAVISYEHDPIGYVDHDPAEAKRFNAIYSAMAELLRAANT